VYKMLVEVEVVQELLEVLLQVLLVLMVEQD
jgi:hypothetical protein